MSITLDVDEEEIPGLFPDGRPDPAYAASLGLLPASPLRRSAAFTVDFVIWLVLVLPAVFATLPLWGRLRLGLTSIGWLTDHPGFSFALIVYCISQGLVLVYLVLQLTLHGRKGVTIGKGILGLRSVNVATFASPGFWRIVLRALVFQLSAIVVPVLGALPFLLSPLWDRDKRGRGWLDAIGQNWLIDIRSGLDPFNAKALRYARKQAAAPEEQASKRMPSLATGADAAVATFVPGDRSRSGVVAPHLDEAPEPWLPPPVGAPAAPAPPPVGAPTTPAPAVTLVFDDGARVRVDGPGLLGRNPTPRAGETAQHLLPLTDDSSRISKTHAAFGVDENGFWIVDRSSTNGTTVTTSAGLTRELTPLEPHRVAFGSTVVVGGRSFTLAPAERTTERANPQRPNSDHQNPQPTKVYE